MRSSFDCVIPFLPLICSSQSHIPAGWRLESQLYSNSTTAVLFYAAEYFPITFCTEHAENTASIVKEVCLLIRCLAMDILFLRGNVFTKSLPKNGCIHHNIIIPLTCRSPYWSLSFWFSHQNPIFIPVLPSC
jgi:hypothetical protein